MCRRGDSLRSKRFRGAKSEERGFRRFARANNGAREKIGRRGWGRGTKVSFLPVPLPPSPPPCSWDCSSRRQGLLHSKCDLSPKRNCVGLRGPNTDPFKRRSLKRGMSFRQTKRTQSNFYAHLRV